MNFIEQKKLEKKLYIEILNKVEQEKLPQGLHEGLHGMAPGKIDTEQRVVSRITTGLVFDTAIK